MSDKSVVPQTVSLRKPRKSPVAPPPVAQPDLYPFPKDLAQPQQAVNFHKLEISNKAPGTLLSGTNVNLTLDGQPLKGVVGLSFHLSPQGVAVVRLEMVADIALVAELGNLEVVRMPLTNVRKE